MLAMEKKEVRFGEWSTMDIEVLNKHLLLTSKPVIYLINMSEKDYIRKKNKWYVRTRVHMCCMRCMYHMYSVHMYVLHVLYVFCTYVYTYVLYVLYILSILCVLYVLCLCVPGRYVHMHVRVY